MPLKYDYAGVDFARNVKALAKEIGCSIQTIYAKRRELGMSISREEWIEKRNQSKKFHLDYITDFVINCNESEKLCYMEDIVEHTGLSNKYVYKLVKQLLDEGVLLKTMIGKSHIFYVK